MTRSLPSRPSLESDRKRAKALRKAHLTGDPEALARLRAHHPRLRDRSPAEIAAMPLRLADAQLVVAREYGVASWPRLVALIHFLRGDFEARGQMLLEAAVGPRPQRARELLAHAPDLAGACLQTACAAGDEAAARTWLEREPAAAARADGPGGATPLWTLCWSGLGPDVEEARVAVAQELLAAGAAPDATAERESDFGRHRAGVLFGAVHHDRPALAEVLLEAGADPNDGECLYHAAERADTRCLALLLRHGARPTGTNALKRALDKPHLEPVRLLLEAGDDPNDAGLGPRRDRTALHHAAERGREPAALDLLLEHGARLDARDDAGETACDLALRHGHLRTVEHLRARGAEATLPPRALFVAHCAAGDGAAARALLETHPDLVARLEPGDHAALPRAAEYGRIEAVELMLDLGFPLEAQGGDFAASALQHAAHMGYPELVRRLLARGADPHLPNEFGGDALAALCVGSASPDAAETFAPGRDEAARQADLMAGVELLVAAGADPSGAPLGMASEPVAEALRRHGALDEEV